MVQRSVWAAMDDGTSEAEIFAIADKVLLTTYFLLPTSYLLPFLPTTRYLLPTYYSLLITLLPDQVFALVDTDNSGDIEVGELKALLLADECGPPLEPTKPVLTY